MFPEDKSNPAGDPSASDPPSEEGHRDKEGEQRPSGESASAGETPSFGPMRIPPEPGAQPFGMSGPNRSPEGAPEDRPPARSLNEREVKVLNIYQYEDRSEYTFVLLQDGRGRKLPIWIGPDQAQAIFIALHKEQCDFHRPLTHDLLKNIVEKLDGKIERLTIDDMWQDTFYARLVLKVGERWVDVDCRPSDGIAVALRAQAPIYVADEVLDSCRLQED